MFLGGTLDGTKETNALASPKIRKPKRALYEKKLAGDLTFT